MNSTEDLMFLAVLDNPEDLTSRAVYADWLEERGDPRGDYLRLDLKLRALNDGDPQIATIVAELRKLGIVLNRHWVACVGDFDCRVREMRTIKLRIDTYGSAPKKYGNAIKVGHVARALLVRNGWEHVGDGRYYSYVRPPLGTKAKTPIIPVEVPTDAEINRMASEFHAKGESAVRIYGPWIVRYQRANSVRYSMRVMMGSEEDRPWEDVRGPAEFEFGVGAPWSVSLTWNPGENTPSWSRSASHEVA